MWKIEKKVLENFERNIYVYLYIFISILALLLRYHFINWESPDYITYLDPWFQQIKDEGGLRALGQPIGNYNVLYLTLMAVLTYIPLRPIILIKGLSFVFDFMGAAVAAMLCKREEESVFNMGSVMVYGALLCIPQVLINSAAWAQCDFSYTACIFLCILLLQKSHPRLAMIAFGIAFWFKLQAVFFLPVLLAHYVTKKEYSVLEFLWIPVMWLVTAIPSLVAGRSFASILRIYSDQVTLYQSLTLSYPNIYYLFRQGDGGWEMYNLFGNMGMMLTLLLLALGCVYAIKKRLVDNKGDFLCFSEWCVFTCVLFLPSMHERYGFMAEMLVICAAFVVKDCRSYIAAVLMNIVAIINYASMVFYVFEAPYVLLTVLNLAAYSILTYIVLERGREEKLTRGK